MKIRKIIYLILFISIVAIVSVRLFSGNEDTWLCQDGQWVKHGQPNSLPPSESCPKQTSELQVFFGNSQLDPGAMECGTTYNVTRQINLSGSKYEAVIKELLSGPTDQEKQLGYFSSINPNIAMPKISLTAGVATLDFQSDFNSGLGGSCRVTAIRSQLVNTLRQFPEVSSVVIAVNGSSTEVLQP